MTPDGLLERADLLRGLARLARKAPNLLKLVRTMAAAKDDTRGSLGEQIQAAADAFGDRPALKWEGGQLTYRAFNERVNQTAHYLQRAGLRQGDTVAVLIAARPEVLVVVAAANKLGAAAAMINIHQRHKALTHSFSCVEPRFYAVGEELVAAFEEVRDTLGDVPDGALLFVRDDGSEAAPAGWVDLISERVTCSRSNPAPDRPIVFGDPAFYIFTSGTTGLPKASIMSHKRWVGAGAMFGYACLGLKPTDTLYSPLPLYHNQALTMSWSAAVATGAALAIRRNFSVSAFWDDCRRHDATVMAYIGEVTRYLLNCAPAAGDRSNPVRKAVGVGMRPDIWSDFKHRFGVDEIYEFYGASELNAAFFNMMNLDRTVGFCPMPWALVAFDVDAGEPVRDGKGHMRKLGRGDTGLLLTKVTDRFKFEGYTDRKASERKLFRDVFEAGDCWVNTGDLMRHIGFGHLQFVDRVGDTFRWKSENVATSEVEQAINADPAVAESTVYGVEVPNMVGRAGMMALVPGDREIDLDALLSRLETDLPGYAVPVFARLTDTLEVTGTFKHRKVELRKDGFDPSRSDDPLFVRLPRSQAGYQPLTADLYDAIMSAKQTL